MSLIAALLFAATVTPMEDPALEARAQDIEREIRCVVCENEPISQSTAASGSATALPPATPIPRCAPISASDTVISCCCGPMSPQ